MNKLFLSVALLALVIFPKPFVAQAADSKDKSAILVVAFGTSMPEARKAIDNLVNAAKDNFPDFETRLAFSSNIIRRKIARENHEIIPTPVQALANLNDEGFTNVYIIPTHIIPGEEYDEIKNLRDSFANLKGKYGFKKIILAEPYLNGVADCDRMAEILSARFREYLNENSDTAVVLMGHGTPEHIANAMYSQLQLSLDKLLYGRFFLGTVEASPKIEDVIANLKRHPQIDKLVISPLMIVAGDHANNDLADEDDDESWISILKANGYGKIEKYLVGLGEDENIRDDFVKKIQKAIDR